MRILVTGGAGYLGSIVVPKLLNAGHSVTVVDNFCYQQVSLADWCWSDNLDIIRADSRDRAVLSPLVAKADAIFPLACLVGAPLCEQRPEDARSINLDAVTMLLEMSGKEQMFISPTTNSGYGIGESGTQCTEESPLRPVSLYGKLKVDLEERLLESNKAVSLRLATVFGMSPRMRLDLLVNDFTYRAVTDRAIVLFESHFKRNYIYIGDVALAFIHALENFDRMKGQAYNVGLDEANLSKKELCEVIKEQLPELKILESPIGKDPDQRDYIVSNEKLKATGFSAQTGLEAGIRELIKGYQIIRRNQYSNV